MNCLTRSIVLLFSVVSLAGCATSPANTAGTGAGDGPELADAHNFYDGEPEVVFSTEFPVASAEDAIARADQALVNGETDLALYLYVRAYDLQRDNEYVLTRIGEIHESRGNTALALQAFMAVLGEDPTHTGALQAAGLMYLKARKYDDALALLERAVELDPKLWRAQNGIGVIADMRGEHATAVQAFDTALEARPDDPALLNNRGYSFYLDGKFDEASQDFAKAATLGLDRAWLNMGLVVARQKQYSRAVQLMQRVVELPFAYNDVGYIAMRQGDVDIARTYFEKAIQLSPRYFEEAQENLGRLETGADSADYADDDRMVRVDLAAGPWKK